MALVRSQQPEALKNRLLDQGYLNTHDLCEYLRAFYPHAYISHPTLYRLIKADPPKVEAIKIGNAFRVRAEEIERFVRFGNRTSPSSGDVPDATLPKPNALPASMSAADLIKMGRRYEQ